MSELEMWIDDDLYKILSEEDSLQGDTPQFIHLSESVSERIDSAVRSLWECHGEVAVSQVECRLKQTLKELVDEGWIINS